MASIMTTRAARAGALLLALLLAGCADGGAVLAAPAPDPPGEPQRYTASAFIIQQGDGTPELCLGTVMESRPPQCGGPPLVGLDWADVPDAETTMGVTFGVGWVVGTFDGTTFTLTEPVRTDAPDGVVGQDDRPAVLPDDRPSELAPLCDDPYRGGAEDAYPIAPFPDGHALGAAGEAAMAELDHRAPSFPGYVEMFVTDGVSEVNLLLTAGSDADAAHDSLREVWDGWLCVATRDVPSAADAQAAMRALSEEAAALGVLVWGPDTAAGRFSADVVRVDGSTLARVNAILAPWYDADQVDLYGALTPLD